MDRAIGRAVRSLLAVAIVLGLCGANKKDTPKDAQAQDGMTKEQADAILAELKQIRELLSASRSQGNRRNRCNRRPMSVSS